MTSWLMSYRSLVWGFLVILLFLWLRWVFVAARAFLQLQGLGAAL